MPSTRWAPSGNQSASSRHTRGDAPRPVHDGQGEGPLDLRRGARRRPRRRGRTRARAPRPSRGGAPRARRPRPRGAPTRGGGGRGCRSRARRPRRRRARAAGPSAPRGGWRRPARSSRSAARATRSFRSAFQRAATASPPSAFAIAHSSRPRPPTSDRGTASASTTRTSASRRRGQAASTSVLPELAHVGVHRRPGDDQEVARARAGHVEEPARLRPPLLLLPPHEGVPVRGLAAPAEADRDPPLLPERHRGDRRVAAVVGVVERHDRRLEALRLVDREDAHRVGVARTGRGQVRLLARVLDPVLEEAARSRAASARRATRPRGRGPPPSRGSRSGPRRGGSR